MITVNKIAVSLAVWVTICCGIVVFAITPAIANFFTIESGAKKQDDQIAANTERIKQIKAFREFSKDQGANLAKIDKLFVSAQNPLDLIDFLESAANDCGIKMEISSSSAIINEGGDTWPSFNFQMTLTGGFSRILEFVKTVETGKYLVFVPSLSISSQGSSDGGTRTFSSNDLKAIMTLTAYVNSDEKQ
jgi:hypothetical protein